MLKELIISYEDYTDCSLTKEEVTEKAEELEYKTIELHKKLENPKDADELQEIWLKIVKNTLEMVAIGKYAESKGF